MKKIVVRVVGVLVAALAVWQGYRFFRQLEQQQAPVPTAVVRRGEVVIRSYTRGELRAVRSVTLVAPNLFGTVQITRLAPLGAVAREKDLIVEFDDSEVRSRLDDKQLELDQLDEQLRKAQAEQEIRNNQDQVELLRARFAVRRAELEVKRNELLSEIDARKNKLNLDEAQRKLKQLESDIKSRLEQSQAELAVLRANKNRATLELQRENARLSQVKLLSPMAGLVAVRQNRGMFMMRGMQLPDLREGDQVFPGLPVADVLDLSELEVAAKVGEVDRANLHEGQEATIRLDAVPAQVFHGKIKNLSGTATANIWSGDPAKKFDVVFSVDMKELLSGLGAKPEQIRRVLETAARNRSKPVATAMPSMAMSMGPEAMGGGAPPGFAPGAGAAGGGFSRGEGQRGGESQRGGEGRGRMSGAGGGGQGGGDQPSPERQKMREAFQKLLAGRNMQDLSQEERQKIFEQMRGMMQQSGGAARPQGQQGASPEAAQGRQRSGAGAPGAMPFAGGPGAMPFPGGPFGGGAGGPFGGGMGLGARSQFTPKDLEQADLPPPPGEDSQLDVLLRPGLLTDLEIIVERVPDAIHIPVQAVFDKEGKPVVYVKTAKGFDERAVKPLKRSESFMVIAAGLAPGELVALADPTARPGKKGDKQGGKKPAIPAPAGGNGGGR